MPTTKTTKVTRPKILTYLNTTPAVESPTYGLLGLGVTTGQIGMNASVTTEQYIHQETAYNSVESYAPNISITQTAYKGDAVYDYVFDLFYNRKTGSDCETDILNVYLVETEGENTYKAERQKVAIEISSYGGDAGSPVQIEYTIHYNGSADKGTATITEGVPTFAKASGN